MEKLKYEKLKVMQPRTRIKSELTVGKKKKKTFGIIPEEVLQS